MARRSFPSGHAAQSFAAMVFFASVYEQLHPDNSGWVWAGCVGSAATIGWLRHEAGYHFTTDILAGVAIGAAAGWLVPRLHEVGGDQETGVPEGVRFAVGFAF
jgi:membrane-associated phospholipid phosphatase